MAVSIRSRISDHMSRIDVYREYITPVLGVAVRFLTTTPVLWVRKQLTTS